MPCFTKILNNDTAVDMFFARVRLRLMQIVSHTYIITVVVFKIIQTPGLWEKDSQTSGGVDLSNTGNSVVQGCSGYCSLT